MIFLPPAVKPIAFAGSKRGRPDIVAVAPLPGGGDARRQLGVVGVDGDKMPTGSAGQEQRRFNEIAAESKSPAALLPEKPIGLPGD